MVKIFENANGCGFRTKQNIYKCIKQRENNCNYISRVNGFIKIKTHTNTHRDRHTDTPA